MRRGQLSNLLQASCAGRWATCRAFQLALEWRCLLHAMKPLPWPMACTGATLTCVVQTGITWGIGCIGGHQAGFFGPWAIGYSNDFPRSGSRHLSCIELLQACCILQLLTRTDWITCAAGSHRLTTQSSFAGRRSIQRRAPTTAQTRVCRTRCPAARDQIRRTYTNSLALTWGWKLALGAPQ